MTTKKQASKCTTHHNACDCREYRYQEMERALKVIHTWAVFEMDHAKENPFHVLKNIANEATEALGREDLRVK